MAMTARAKPPKTKGTKIATDRYLSKCTQGDPINARSSSLPALVALLHLPTVSEVSSSELGAMSVLSETGASTEVASLWSNSHAVLVFLRHFG